MVNEQELEIVDGLRRRDPVILDRMIDKWSDTVFRLALFILGAYGGVYDAEEVAADVFASAWLEIDAYDASRASFRTWLLMKTKFAALERRRQIRRERVTASGEPRVVPITAVPNMAGTDDVEQQYWQRDRQEQLYRALAKLPEADQELIIRRYFLDEPIQRLAEEAGISRNAMDNRLRRARLKLREHLTGGKGADDRDDQAL